MLGIINMPSATGETEWKTLLHLERSVKKKLAAGDDTLIEDLGQMHSILTETFNRHNTINLYSLEDWLRLYESMMEVNSKMFVLYRTNQISLETFNTILRVRDAFEGKNGILVRVEKRLKISPDDSASGAHMGATGALMAKSPVMRKYLAAHSTSDPTLYPNAVVQLGKHPVDIRIKRLDCNKPHHITRYFGYLRSFAERLDKVIFSPWNMHNKDAGDFCLALSGFRSLLQEQHAFGTDGIRPRNVFHYVAYLPQSMDILGWMICEEYSAVDTAGIENTFVFVPYMQTMGQFGKYKGIGGEMIKRMAAYCRSRSIHFVMFYSGTKTLMKKAKKRVDAKHLGRKAGLFTHSLVDGFPTKFLIESMRLH